MKLICFLMYFSLNYFCCNTYIQMNNTLHYGSLLNNSLYKCPFHSVHPNLILFVLLNSGYDRFKWHLDCECFIREYSRMFARNLKNSQIIRGIRKIHKLFVGFSMYSLPLFFLGLVKIRFFNTVYKFINKHTPNQLFFSIYSWNNYFDHS